MTAPVPIDLVVRTDSAEGLDRILCQLPMPQARVVPESWDEREQICLVRVATHFNAGFVRFALHRQGYGEVLDERVAP